MTVLFWVMVLMFVAVAIIVKVSKSAAPAASESVGGTWTCSCGETNAMDAAECPVCSFERDRVI